MLTRRRYPIPVSFVLLLTLGACGGERPDDGGGPLAANETTTVKRSHLESDGSACTVDTECTSGFCVDGVCCDAACTNQCAACNLTGLVGTCSPEPNGAVCNDGNACTVDDACSEGSCQQGATPFTCLPPDTCHNAGTCDSNRPLPAPPLTQDLLGWWKLDGNGEDETAGNHDLANEGAVAVPGRSGMAMRFDGTSCMTTPIWDEARMQGASGVTIMAWINPDVYVCDEVGPGQHDMNAVAGRGWDYSIGSLCIPYVPSWYGQGIVGHIRPANYVGWGYGGGSGSGLGWHHVAVTWDHQTMYTFLDGKGIAGSSIPGDISDIDPRFAVGCMTSWYWSGEGRVNNFHGAVDEVMLYGRALTGEEIASYYADADPCTHQPLADNTPCFDGNHCTQGDVCTSGVCVGPTPVTCVAPDQCHDPGTCYSWAGCVNPPPKPEGAACDDSNACTPTDGCQGGVCVGAGPVTCASAMRECGSIDDGCGGTLNCGSCNSSSHCNLAGRCVLDPSVADVPTGVDICRILLEALTVFIPTPACRSCSLGEILNPLTGPCCAPGINCLSAFLPECSFRQIIDLIEQTISADSYYCSADMSAEDFFKHLVAGRIQNLAAITASGLPLPQPIANIYSTYLEILTAAGRSIPANAQDIIAALISADNSGFSIEDMQNVKIVRSDLPTASMFLIGNTHAITLGPVIVVRAELYNIIFDPANARFTTNDLLNMPVFKMPPDPINCCNANLPTCQSGNPPSCLLNSQYRDMIDMLIHELAHVHQYSVWGQEGFLLSYLFSTLDYQARNALSSNPTGALNEFERQACLYGAGLAALTSGNYCVAAKPFHDFTAGIYGFSPITCM